MSAARHPMGDHPMAHSCLSPRTVARRGGLLPACLAAALLVASAPGEARADPQAARPDEVAQPTLAADLPGLLAPNKIGDADVQRRIDAGVKYLKSIQSRNGRIGTKGRVFNMTYPVGQTALALLAMLEAGVPMTDPSARRALSYAFETPADHTYEVALQAMVLAKLPKDKRGRSHRRSMEQVLKRLVDWQADDGMWSYWLVNPRNVPGIERGGRGITVGRNWRDRYESGDNSNTQFAVLALWELGKRGVEIPEPALRRAADHFLKTQSVANGWYYVKCYKDYGLPSQSPTMTATGLASLYILRDLLGEKGAAGEGVFDGQRSDNCGRTGPFDAAINRAFTRVEADLDGLGGLAGLYGGPPFPLSGYYSYSIERIGVACGLKQIGRHDWYREGVWYYLSHQRKDGSWTVGYNPAVETSLAVLFLAKGRAPFIVNKLRWPGDWSNHTRDLRNLVTYAENTFEQRFRWQIVDVRGKVDEWLDAPVLYLSGHESPGAIAEEDRRKLREFAERGGVILADNCCKARPFDEGFRLLVKQVFPESELRELAPGHAVYSSHFKLKMDRKRPVLGLDLPADKLAAEGRQLAGTDATRTVLIYAPWTIGCAWHQNQTTNYEWIFQLGINVFRHATGKRPLRRPLDGYSAPMALPARPEPAQQPGVTEDPFSK